MDHEDGFYKALLDNLHDGVYFTDRDRKITYWNKGAERLTGYSADEIVGSRCADNILAHVDEEGCNLCEGSCPLAATMSDGGARQAEVFLHHKEGHRLPVLVRVSPIRNSDGEIIGGVEVFSDNSASVAARKKLAELHEMALLDDLTGIPNRRLLEITLRRRFDEMSRYPHWSFGVVFIDVDDFKETNDLYGHDTGDAVLRMIAGTLSGALRSVDVVGRWGGDEFLAVALNLAPEELEKIADRVRALVEKSYLSLEERLISCTVSVGVTLACRGDTVDTLMKRVDELMYLSKLSGRNSVSAVCCESDRLVGRRGRRRAAPGA
jgi:diguanylate cyclase (GGDEF)-like protein/PAS domain S-box-containing protein